MMVDQRPLYVMRPIPARQVLDLHAKFSDCPRFTKVMSRHGERTRPLIVPYLVVQDYLFNQCYTLRPALKSVFRRLWDIVMMR